MRCEVSIVVEEFTEGDPQRIADAFERINLQLTTALFRARYRRMRDGGAWYHSTIYHPH